MINVIFLIINLILIIDILITQMKLAVKQHEKHRFWNPVDLHLNPGSYLIVYPVEGLFLDQVLALIQSAMIRESRVMCSNQGCLRTSH